MARARKPFLTSEESRTIWGHSVHPTKAKAEQVLGDALQKLSKMKYISYSDRIDYKLAYDKMLILQKMDEQQYQRAREKYAGEIKNFVETVSRHQASFTRHEVVIKMAAWIIGGLLILFFLSALGL